MTKLLKHISTLRRGGQLALLAGLCALAGCGDAFGGASSDAAMAETQLAAGNLEEARNSIRKAIGQRDDVAAYYILLARIELQAQRPESAFNAYSLALDLQADNPEVLQNLAELGLQTGRVREAREAADRMLLLAPNSSRAMLVKGFLAIDEGRLDEARQIAGDLLQLNANDEGGIILLARVEALRGDLAAAEAAIQRAIPVIGSTNALNVTLLEIYRIQGDAKGMRSVLPAIVKGLTENSDYQLDFINLLYKSGDTAAARSESVKAVTESPNDAAFARKLAALWLEYDRRPLSASQQAYLAESGTRTWQLALGRFYEEIGDHAAAERLLLRTFEGGVPEAQGLMARVKLSRGDLKRADAIAARVLAEDPRNEDALLVRSARHLAAGKSDRAIEDANIIVADAPEEYLGYVALANAYGEKGGFLRARQTFERGVDFLPQSRLLADAYAAFLRNRGDKSRLVSLYQDLALAKPSSVPSWAAYSHVCSEAGDALCASKASAGMARARTSFLIDEAPGTPRRRGLFARIIPEQICAATGGVCTGS